MILLQDIQRDKRCLTLHPILDKLKLLKWRENLLGLKDASTEFALKARHLCY